MPALTESEMPGSTERVATLGLLLLKRTAVTVWSAVTVTVAPGTITAVSNFPGTEPPTQVALEFQLPPDAVLTRVDAPHPSPAPNSVKASTTSVEENGLFTFFNR